MPAFGSADSMERAASKPFDWSGAVSTRAGEQRALTAPRDQLLANQYGDLLSRQSTMQGFTARDRGNLSAQYGLDVAGLEFDRARTGRQLEATRSQLPFLDRDLGLARQAQQLGNTSAASKLDSNLRAFKDDFSQRGAAFSNGTQSTNADLRTQYDQALAGNQLQFDNAQLGNDRARGDVKNQEAQLELVAQQYGVKGQQLKLAFERGLDKLNLGAFIDASQLADALTSVDMQRRAIAEQVARQALDAATQDRLSWTNLKAQTQATNEQNAYVAATRPTSAVAAIPSSSPPPGTIRTLPAGAGPRIQVNGQTYLFPPPKVK